MFANWTIRRRLVVLTVGSTALVIAIVIALLFGNLLQLVTDYAAAAVIERGARVTGALEAHLSEASTVGREAVAEIGSINGWRAAPLWNSAMDAVRGGVVDSFGLVSLPASGAGYQTVIFEQPRTSQRMFDLTLDFSAEYPDTIPPLRAGADVPLRWYYAAPPAGAPREEGRIVLVLSRDAESGAMAWIEITIERLEAWLVATEETTADALRLNERILIADTNDVFASLRFSGTLPTLSEFNEVFGDIPVGDLDLQADVFGQEQPQLAAEFTVPSAGWRIGLLASSAALVDPVVQNVLLLAVIVITALVALGWFVSQFITRAINMPLEDLTRSAQEIGTGDLRYVVRYREQRDEIGGMARALEDMKLNIAHSYEALSSWSRTLEHRVTERTAQLDAARADALATARELRAVYDASLSVVNEYYLQIILQTLTGRVSELLRASYAGVWLLTDDGDHLQLVAATADPSVIGRQVEISEGLVGAVVRAGKPMIEDDYPGFARRLPWLATEFTHALSVPLIYSGSVSGAIIAGRDDDAPPFTEDDQRLLSLLANLASPVVRNAQLFEERDAAVKAAQQASEVKTRFLASVTHELRTPLNLIINNMDFMRIGAFGEVNEEQSQRLDQTIRSAEHLLYLINDLLDVSKIEAGEMQLFIQPSDLHPVIEDALDATMPMLAEKPTVAISVDLPETLPTVEMDARRVRQVLLNLISNAVKFTQEGEVNLTVTADADQVTFAVRDTGIGIPEEELRSIFEAFERSTRAKQMGIEGTGLGLPISRYLVEAHGGTMTVETQVGVGTTFYVTLPLRQASRAQHGANGHGDAEPQTAKVTGLLHLPAASEDNQV